MTTLPPSSFSMKLSPHFFVPTPRAPLDTAGEVMPDLMYRRSLEREEEFVTLGARTRLSGARAARFDFLLESNARGESLDWVRVVALCEKHRVFGLLGRQLSARRWKSVPPLARARWDRYFAAVSLHSAALTGELLRVCSALEAAGIPVVSFKGPTLARAAYGNGVVRPFADLDVLVSRSQVQGAHELLRSLGYAHEANLSPWQERAHLQVDSVFNLWRPAPPELAGVLPQGFALELHWGITSPHLPFDFHFQDLAPRLEWIDLGTSNAQRGNRNAEDFNAQIGTRNAEKAKHDFPTSGFPVPRSGACVRALAPTDLLLILAVHGSKHLWERLLWICDIAQVIEHTPDLDFDILLRDASTRGVERMTALGLSLARDVMGTFLPREVETWLSQQPQALHLGAQLRASLWELPDEEEVRMGLATGGLGESRTTLQMAALLARSVDDPWKRVGLFSHLVTTPSAIERAQMMVPPGLQSLWWVLGRLRSAHHLFLPRAQRKPR